MPKETPPRGHCRGCSLPYALYQGKGENKGRLVCRKHLSRIGPGECAGSQRPPLNGDATPAEQQADPFTSPTPVPEMDRGPANDHLSPPQPEEVVEDIPFTPPTPVTVVLDGDADGRADMAPDTDPHMTQFLASTGIVPGESSRDMHRKAVAVYGCQNSKPCADCADAPDVQQLTVCLGCPDTNGRADHSGCVVGSAARLAAMQQPDPFQSPGAASDIPESDTTVSGQPKPDRDRWKRYLIQGQAYTRATTFAKFGSNTKAIEAWGHRLVTVGLTRRPDLLALAEGLEVKRDRDQLNKIVEQAKDAAGQKIAANIGTAYHAFTERVDAGLIYLSDVPEKYRSRVQQYRDVVYGAGLTTRPEWIERTTAVTADMVSAPVPVAGTLDRIYQLPDGSRCIGDLKTGSSLEYGMAEIEVQLAVYAHGVNRFGLFDWNTKEWTDENGTGGPERLRVRTDFAIVVHLPADGDGCTLIRVDLERGWERARLRGQIQFDQKAKSHPQLLTREDIAPRPTPAERGEVAEYMASRAEHTLNDGNGGVWTHPGTVADCRMVDCLSLKETALAPDPWDAPHMVTARRHLTTAPDKSTIAGLFQFAMDSGKFSAHELELCKSLGMKRLRDLGLM